MDAERWQQVKQIFQAALDVPRPERAAYAGTACGGDEELRREVVSLLAVGGRHGRLPLENGRRLRSRRVPRRRLSRTASR